MKVFTFFAKVKIRLLHKSIFAKVEMVDFCKSRGPLNGTILSSILILTFAKNDLFLEKPGKILQKSKSKSKNRRTHAL